MYIHAHTHKHTHTRTHAQVHAHTGGAHAYEQIQTHTQTQKQTHTWELFSEEATVLCGFLPLVFAGACLQGGLQAQLGAAWRQGPRVALLSLAADTGAFGSRLWMGPAHKCVVPHGKGRRCGMLLPIAQCQETDPKPVQEGHVTRSLLNDGGEVGGGQTESRATLTQTHSSVCHRSWRFCRQL